MFSIDLLMAGLPAQVRLGTLALWHPFLVLGTIAGFFNNLYGQLCLFAMAMTIFFFAWAAILYGASGTSNDPRTKAHAISALYAALAGLALALLAGSAAAIILTSAAGQ
jgi:hypothetical protein